MKDSTQAWLAGAAGGIVVGGAVWLAYNWVIRRAVAQRGLNGCTLRARADNTEVDYRASRATNVVTPKSVPAGTKLTVRGDGQVNGRAVLVARTESGDDVLVLRDGLYDRYDSVCFV